MQLNFINTLPCPVNLSYTTGSHHQESIILDDKIRNFATEFLPALEEISAEVSFTDGNDCNGLAVGNSNSRKTLLGKGESTEGYAVLITLRDGNLVLTRLNDATHLKKSISGEPMLG